MQVRFLPGAPDVAKCRIRKPTILKDKMNMSPVPLIILSGPVGVGKSSVANEISEQLVGLGVAHTFVDFDALAQTYPRPADDPHGNRLATENLRAIWRNAASAGSRNVIIAKVVETLYEVEALEKAVPESKTIVFQLRAGEQQLRERIAKREIGSGHNRHVERALELSLSLERDAPADFIIETDAKQVSEIAKEVMQHVQWSVAAL